MRVRRLVPALALTAAAVLSACAGGSGGGAAGGSGSAGAAAVKGGTLTFLFPTAPLDLDPSTSQDNNVSMPLWKAWFETLVVYDGSTYRPWLATSWTESKDKKTYEFTLDPRARFSDGTPVTGQDVVAALTRTIGPDVSLLNFLKAKIAAFTAPSATTVRITLKQPWPHLLADLASPNGAIYSKAALDKAGDAKKFFNQTPVGTGPFTLGAITANSSYTVQRNPSYWKSDAQPFLDRIQFQVVTDDTARVTAVVGGRADIAQSPPPNQLNNLKANSAVHVYAFPAARVQLFALNTAKPPFDNAKVRQAFSLALDRKAMVQTGLFGYGEPASTFLVAPASQTFQDTSLALYPFDLDRAKQTLASAGVPLPVTVPMTVSTGADQDAILTVAQANLEKIGFKVVPTRKDAASVDNDIIGKSYSANTTFWGNVSGDPAIQSLFAIDPAYCCDAYFTSYKDPALVSLTHQAVAEADPAKAKPLWDDVQRKVADAAFIVPLYYPQLTYLSSTKVAGFAADPAGFYDWSKVGKSGS